MHNGEKGAAAQLAIEAFYNNKWLAWNHWLGKSVHLLISIADEYDQLTDGELDTRKQVNIT